MEVPEATHLHHNSKDEKKKKIIKCNFPVFCVMRSHQDSYKKKQEKEDLFRSFIYFRLNLVTRPSELKELLTGRKEWWRVKEVSYLKSDYGNLSYIFNV